MLRKVIGAALVVVLFAGVTFAEQIRGVILKVDGDNVTFAPVEGRGPDAKRGEEKTLPVAKDVKVLEGRFNKQEKKFEGDTLEGGLKNKRFSKIGKKGLGATIITDADSKTITEIRLRKRNNQ